MRVTTQQTVLPYNTCNVRLAADDVHDYLTAHGVQSTVSQADLAIFQQAFVHRSYVGGDTNRDCPPGCVPLQPRSNERLEFLGDAVLGLAVASYVYDRFPYEDEGFLTRIRSCMVRGSTLALMCDSLRLGRHALLSRQVEDQGGRIAARVKEDLFEAFVGALRLVHGVQAAIDWSISVFERYLDISEFVREQCSCKEHLNDFFSRELGAKPVLSFSSSASASASGAARAPVVRVVVRDPTGVVVGVGSGSDRREAEEAASRAALRYYGRQPTEDVVPA